MRSSCTIFSHRFLLSIIRNHFNMASLQVVWKRRIVLTADIPRTVLECPVCKDYFTGTSRLYDHLQAIHPDDPLESGRIFSQSEATMRQNTMSVCPICEIKMPEGTVDSHTRAHHSGISSRLNAPHPSASSPSVSKPLGPTSTQPRDLQYFCGLCKNMFLDRLPRVTFLCNMLKPTGKDGELIRTP